MKVGMIGAGAWGTALAYCIANGGTNVVLWSFDGNYAHFDGCELPKKVKVTTRMNDLRLCHVFLVATPAAFFRETMKNFAPIYKTQPIIICTKGAEPKTGKFMDTVLSETVFPKKSNIGVLSGPQFAGEVARGCPTASTLAGSKTIQTVGEQIFTGLNISQTDDIIGTETCGVGKNAVSLISGYIYGKGSGENESAMCTTMAWQEVIEIGLKTGAKLATFFDFCGIGDLLLTATSKTSRNFSAGVSIANGEMPDGTVEGISALNALVNRAKINCVSATLLTQMRDQLLK